MTLREDEISNELKIHFCIDSSMVDIDGDISINRHSRQQTEVFGFLVGDFVRDTSPRFPISMSGLSKLRVDARFIKKYKLIRSPIRQLYNPSSSENWITL